MSSVVLLVTVAVALAVGTPASPLVWAWALAVVASAVSVSLFATSLPGVSHTLPMAKICAPGMTVTVCAAVTAVVVVANANETPPTVVVSAALLTLLIAEVPMLTSRRSAVTSTFLPMVTMSVRLTETDDCTPVPAARPWLFMIATLSVETTEEADITTAKAELSATRPQERILAPSPMVTSERPTRTDDADPAAAEATPAAPPWALKAPARSDWSYLLRAWNCALPAVSIRALVPIDVMALVDETFDVVEPLAPASEALLASAVGA